jgi:hypothetical protein
MKRLWINPLDVAGRIDADRKGREQDHAQGSGDKDADAEGPHKLRAQYSSLVHFRVSLRHRSTHGAARNEDQEVNRDIAQDEQRNGRAREDGGAKRDRTHHICECRLVNVVRCLEG